MLTVKYIMCFLPYFSPTQMDTLGVLEAGTCNGGLQTVRYLVFISITCNSANLIKKVASFNRKKHANYQTETNKFAIVFINNTSNNIIQSRNLIIEKILTSLLKRDIMSSERLSKIC